MFRVLELKLLLKNILFTLQLLSYASIPGALLYQGGRAGEDIRGVRQQELQVFVKQSHAARVLEQTQVIVLFVHLIF